MQIKCLHFKSCLGKSEVYLLTYANKQTYNILSKLNENKKGTANDYLFTFNEDNSVKKCRICGRGFLGLEMLEKHLKIHNVNKNFECETCEKKFKNKQLLELHSRNCQGNKEDVNISEFIIQKGGGETEEKENEK